MIKYNFKIKYILDKRNDEIHKERYDEELYLNNTYKVLIQSNYSNTIDDDLDEDNDVNISNNTELHNNNQNIPSISNENL